MRQLGPLHVRKSLHTFQKHTHSISRKCMCIRMYVYFPPCLSIVSCARVELLVAAAGHHHVCDGSACPPAKPYTLNYLN